MVIAVYIILVALVWYIMTSIMATVQLVGRSVAMQVGSVDSTYVAIDGFHTSLFTYFLPLALITLLYWAFVYSQMKGRVMGE